MLCLGRYVGQSIVISGNIRVKVYEIADNHGRLMVRLAVDAPAHVTVHREEIQKLVEKEWNHGR